MCVTASWKGVHTHPFDPSSGDGSASSWRYWPHFQKDCTGPTVGAGKHVGLGWCRGVSDWGDRRVRLGGCSLKYNQTIICSNSRPKTFYWLYCHSLHPQKFMWDPWACHFLTVSRCSVQDPGLRDIPYHNSRFQDPREPTDYQTRLVTNCFFSSDLQLFHFFCISIVYLNTF